MLALLVGLVWASSSPARAAPLGGLTVTVRQVHRLATSVELLLVIDNRTGQTVLRAGLADPAFDHVDTLRFNDLSGVRLLDVRAQTEYLPLRDAASHTCICSRLVPIAPGAHLTVWWRSAPLPETVRRVDVLLPDGSVLAPNVAVGA